MGLLGTAAKAYVATRVIGSTHRRQQRRWAEQEAGSPAPAAPAPHPAAPVAHPAPPGPAAPASQPPTAPAAGPSVLDQLTQLGQLRDAGVLTEAEFEAQKQRILAG